MMRSIILVLAVALATLAAASLPIDIPHWKEARAQVGPIPGMGPSPAFTCKPTTTFTGPTLSATSDGWSGFTLRQVLSSSLLSSWYGCARASVSMSTPSDNGANVGAWYVCNQGGSQSYSCGSTPVQLTVGGSGSFSMGTSSTQASDYVQFQWSGGNLVVSTYFSGTSSLAVATSYTGGTSYYKSGNDASNQSPTGYTLDAASSDYGLASMAAR